MSGNNSKGLNQQQHEFDVCVIGGGMAGLCAALAAARNGARTCLVHDRPVLGGNASSEIRMHICGAHGKHNKETGILEEIQLENSYRNPAHNFSIWDSVLWGKAFFQPNLTPLLNCSCTAAEMDARRIVRIQAWQLTSQTWHTIQARQFIDCSGDSILAGLTGADFRTGREARAEFNEDIEPQHPDQKTMGNSLLIQLRRTDTPQPFIPPRWAYKFTRPEDLPKRIDGVKAHNFWWMELGGLSDTIRDAETIRDELTRVAYGVWDYIKNHSPQKAEAECWALEWLGSLPGKRENRRYVGPHVLTQNDVRDGGRFTDIVAYGGWSMDDHHPAGLMYPGYPTIFHPAPSPYGIPYRCLYSRNTDNLLFAGRNISVTHAALSSTRVMATCALLGQAAGTAAALCVRHRCDPSGLYPARVGELQATLMDDDVWLPGLLRPASALAKSAKLSGEGRGLPLLLDGLDRDRENETHAWVGVPGTPVEFRWAQPVSVGGVRLVFDSNLNDPKHLAHTFPQRGDCCRVPSTLVKRFRLEVAEAGGGWRTVHQAENNYQRLLRVPLEVRTTALRLVPEETWGSESVRVFAVEPLETCAPKLPTVPDGPSFRAVIASVDPKDLAPPDSGLERRK